jgi:hypothetical protein
MKSSNARSLIPRLAVCDLPGASACGTGPPGNLPPRSRLSNLQVAKSAGTTRFISAAGKFGPSVVRPSPTHRYFRPRGGSHLRLFPWHRREGSHIPYQSLIELRAAYTPDVARSVSGHPPSLSRRKGHPAVLTSPNPLSTLQKQFACARLSRSCLPGSSPRHFRDANDRGF